MSSPSNVVVIITGVHPRVFNGENHIILPVVATQEWWAWRDRPDQYTEKKKTLEELERPKHTDQLIDAFFHHVMQGHALVEGAEGDIISFAYAGNHINIDDFCEEIMPFVQRLLKDNRFVSATVMYQPHDMNARVYKIDGTTEGKVRLVNAGGPAGAFSFDVNLSQLRP
jgi:hypothetical protein